MESKITIKDCVTQADAAKSLGVSRQRINQLLDSGLLPSVKIRVSRRVRMIPSAVLAKFKKSRITLDASRPDV